MAQKDDALVVLSPPPTQVIELSEDKDADKITILPSPPKKIWQLVDLSFGRRDHC